MYTKKIGMFVILSLSIATVVMGTAGMNLVSPAFAGGWMTFEKIQFRSSHFQIRYSESHF